MLKDLPSFQVEWGRAFGSSGTGCPLALGVGLRDRVFALSVLCVMLCYTILLSTLIQLEEESLAGGKLGEISRYIRTSSPSTLITLFKVPLWYSADLYGTRGGASAYPPSSILHHHQVQATHRSSRSSFLSTFLPLADFIALTQPPKTEARSRCLTEFERRARY